MKELIYSEYWKKMRKDLILLIGTKYRYGAETSLAEWPPVDIDCSELVELVNARRGIPCPDGAHNQWLESYCVDAPRPGDLGFWQDRKKARPGRHGIYHVGIIFSDTMMIEARAKDKKGRFGEVIYRSRYRWENWEPFQRAGGFRRLKVLSRV